MSLRIAVQMDPLENINISGDSTFAIMLGAQERRHKLYHYVADALTYADGRLWAGAQEVIVQRGYWDGASDPMSGVHRHPTQADLADRDEDGDENRHDQQNGRE